MVLLVAAKDEPIELIFSEMFEERTFQVDVVECYNEHHLQQIKKDLSDTQYDVVIPTNSGLSPWYIPELVSFIKHSHARTKVVVVSGHDNVDFVLDLTRRGIDDFFFIIHEDGELLRRIKELLKT